MRIDAIESMRRATRAYRQWVVLGVGLSALSVAFAVASIFENGFWPAFMVSALAGEWASVKAARVNARFWRLSARQSRRMFGTAMRLLLDSEEA